jgi:hypothetical protein
MLPTSAFPKMLRRKKLSPSELFFTQGNILFKYTFGKFNPFPFTSKWILYTTQEKNLKPFSFPPIPPPPYRPLVDLGGVPAPAGTSIGIATAHKHRC